MSDIGNKDIMAKNLRRYIDRSGKDRRELAEIWGFPYSTVTEWINGRKYPRIDRIEVMADYFGILKSDLIEDKKDTPSSGNTKLTEGEQMLLDLFRQVPEDQQQLVLQMIRAALALGNQ
jgi:repressor LexA